MKTVCYITAALLLFSANVQAKPVPCTVATIKNQMVTLNCQQTESILEIGQRVTVKEVKKKEKKVIEGC